MENDVDKRERLPVSVSAAVFIEDEEGRLLMVQQAAERKGYKWGPPAGGMGPHEDPIMAAYREVIEELGIEDIELTDMLGIYTVDRGENTSGVGFVFRGKITSGTIKTREEEIKDYRFFTISEVEEIIHQDMLYKPEYNLNCIQDWLEGKSYPLEIIKKLTEKQQLFP